MMAETVVTNCSSTVSLPSFRGEPRRRSAHSTRHAHALIDLLSLQIRESRWVPRTRPEPDRIVVFYRPVSHALRVWSGQNSDRCGTCPAMEGVCKNSSARFRKHSH